MVSVANLLQALKSSVNLLPKKYQSLLKPGRPNIEPIQISLKFGTTRVKELFALAHVTETTGEKDGLPQELSEGGAEQGRHIHTHWHL